MPSNSDYRQLMLKIAEASRREDGRKMSSRESLDTLILGALSTSLGIALVADMGMRLIGGMKLNLSPDTFIITTYTGGALGIAGILLARRGGGSRLPSRLSEPYYVFYR